jgi:4-diphosphocytidyl-2-C-methyl-D-erythritol kinase
LTLGADCPFFIENTPAFASGAGEILNDVDLSLKGYFLIVLKPPRSVATKEAFARIAPSIPKFQLSDSVQQPVENWIKLIQNDFEPSIFPSFPEIAQIKSQLMNCGAIYSAMSGSGSSVFGLFNHDPGFERTDFPLDYFIWKETL